MEDKAPQVALPAPANERTPGGLDERANRSSLPRVHTVTNSWFMATTCCVLIIGRLLWFVVMLIVAAY